MDLVDRDKLYNEVDQRAYSLEKAKRIIKEFPTVDPRPYAYWEYRHSRWIPGYLEEDCHYCPVCGARIVGRSKDE